MHRIVSGSFPDFAGAARGVSALMAAGFTDGGISIIALPQPDRLPPSARPRTENVRAGASMLGAIGAMAGPGTGWAWALPDPGAVLVWAPAAGALAGACLGAIVGLLVDRFADRAAPLTQGSSARHRVDAESVTVVVDEAHAGEVEAILRKHGAALVPRRRERRYERRRAPPPAARPLLLVPYRP